MYQHRKSDPSALVRKLITTPRCVLLAVSLYAAGGEVMAEYPEAGRINNEQRLLANTRQLIFEGRRSGEGYFSADGSKMIFQSEREPGNPFYQMYVLDLHTGDTQRVSTGYGKATCGWIHPSARKVLFASTHEDPKAMEKQREELDKRAAGHGSRYSWSFDEHYDIYERDLDGEQLKNLTHTLGYDAEGSWSPDGKLIAFASNREAYARELSPEEQKIFANDQSYFMDIYIMAADGTGVRRVTDTPGYDGGPFFSPDGKRIVWRRFSKEGTTAEVWTMNIDGTDQRQLTRLGVMSWAPYYHPSGDYIIFTNNAQGYRNFELYLVAAEGHSAPVRVTNAEGFDGLAVFTPDGKRLAWASSRTPHRQAQIFIADWNDPAARELLGLVSTSSTQHVDAVTAPGPDLTQTTAAITPQDLRLHVRYLASQALEGRLTGSRGERLATAYVSSVFQSLGLTPAGDDGAWFQGFEFTSGVSMQTGNALSLNSGDEPIPLEVDRDWRPLAMSRVGRTDDAEVVFAGYGIVAPPAEGLPVYDAYAGLDVKDKWVMVFRYLPEDISPEHRQHLANYSNLHYKAMLARDKGAQGIVVVSGPNARVKDQLIELSEDTAVARVSIAAVSISDSLAQKILAGAGKNLQEQQDIFDTGKSIAGFPIPRVTLGADIRLRRNRETTRNVLARLSLDDTPKASVVIIGAHVDHIGRGEIESLAAHEGKGKVHYGADDNASGVAALLEIAQYLTDQKSKGELALEHDILFAAWSGEELGSLGSSHFVKTLLSNEQTPRPPLVAYLNMDMVGRLDKHLYLQGTGSSSIWTGELERRNVLVGLPIVTQADSYLPTDATAFYLKGVPILNAFTGAHPDYNTPRDRPDRINYDGTAKVARLMALITRSLAMRDELPDYVAMEKPAGSPGRRNLPPIWVPSPNMRRVTSKASS